MVAKIILQQIGGKALYMWGAKNKLAHENALSFKIRGSKVANHVKITLNEKDYYDIEFGKIRNLTYKKVKVVEDVSCDMLRDIIGETVCLASSL